MNKIKLMVTMLLSIVVVSNVKAFEGSAVTGAVVVMGAGAALVEQLMGGKLEAAKLTISQLQQELDASKEALISAQEGLVAQNAEFDLFREAQPTLSKTAVYGGCASFWNKTASYASAGCSIVKDSTKTGLSAAWELTKNGSSVAQNFVADHKVATAAVFAGLAVVAVGGYVAYKNADKVKSWFNWSKKPVA